MASYRKRQTLLPSILRIFEAMNVRAWITPEGRVAHDGNDELRSEIGDAIERVRATGARRTALLFGAVLVVAIERGCFTREDIESLDHMGVGNGSYLLDQLEEIERNDSE